MGAMDKILGFMNLNNREDEYEEEYDDEDGYEESTKNSIEDEPAEEDDNKIRPFERERKPITGNVFSKRKAATPMANNDVSVCVFKPKGFDEAREIAETLLENKIIMLNFEGVDISVAQRVLDVVTGTCIAINGKLQKMSNSIFIATPENVELSGDYLASQLDL